MPKETDHHERKQTIIFGTVTAALILLLVASAGVDRLKPAEISGQVSKTADSEQDSPLRPQGNILYSADGIRCFSVLTTTEKGRHFHYGYQDEEGNLLAPASLVEAESFLNGLALVKDGKQYQLIDTSMTVVHTYDRSYSYLERLADDLLLAHQSGRRGLLNLAGEEVLPCRHQRLEPYKANPNLFIAGQEGVDGQLRFGLITTSGDVVQPFLYDFIYDISDDHPGLALGYQQTENDQTTWCYLDAEGQKIELFSHVQAYPFREGYGIVSVTEDQHHVLDQQGAVLYTINNKLDYPEFRNGYLEANDGRRYWAPGFREREVSVLVQNEPAYSYQAAFVQDGVFFIPAEILTTHLRYQASAAPSGQIYLCSKQSVITGNLYSNEITVNLLDDGEPARTVSLDAAFLLQDGQLYLAHTVLEADPGLKLRLVNNAIFLAPVNLHLENPHVTQLSESFTPPR